MLQPRVVLGTRRFLELEKQLNETNLELAYAFCVGLGYRPHWDSARDTLHLHSPFKGRRILVDVDLVLGNDETYDETEVAQHAEPVVQGFEAGAHGSGARVLRTWLPGEMVHGPWQAARESKPVLVLGLRARLVPMEGSDFRLTYSFNHFMMSRRVAMSAARHLRERFRGTRGGTYFLWNGLTDATPYRMLTRIKSPGVVFEWVLPHVGSRRGLDAYGAPELLGEALFDSLEEAFLAEEHSLPVFRYDDERLRRVLWEFEVNRRGDLTSMAGGSGSGVSPEVVTDDLPARAEQGTACNQGNQQPRVQRHEGRAFTSSDWVSSGDVAKQRREVSRMLGDPELEQQGREVARQLRGG